MDIAAATPSTATHTGTVNWYNAEQGYGFITDDAPTHEQVFVNYSDIDVAGYRSLNAGQPVRFESQDTARGPIAKHVQLSDVGAGVEHLGTVKWFNAERGYGYIIDDAAPTGTPFYVHYTSVQKAGFRTLDAGERVGFYPAPSLKGPEALYVHSLERGK